ncbi:hypothetical protein [Streptococcus oralis]|uniref:Uncharacterized protein n=1 Tax=Streptococcus oralis subsp. oralis TaxID=1891914 RepID=A0A0F2CUS7_STROR|nr:hypothetical protein [Streptococcus oralis]KJQ61116.1 hypothetical protein TZ87_01823 [Streptococcus oralis subsp. oralis]
MSKIDFEELKDIEDILESPWEFKSFDEETTVKIEQKLFNRLHLNCINVINDFYVVESLHRIGEKVDEKTLESLKQLSNEFFTLLSMKKFYLNELRKFKNHIKSLDYNMDSQKVWLKINKLKNIDNLEGVLEYLLVNKNNFMPFERFCILNYIYKIVFIDEGHSDFSIGREILDSDFIYNYSITQNLYDLVKNIVDVINDSIKKLQMLFIQADYKKEYTEEDIKLEIFGKEFKRVVDKYNISQYYKNKNNCYASVKLKQIKYITVNGIEPEEIKKESNLSKFIECLKELLGENNVKYVKISDNTQYHMPNGDCILYRQYDKLGENCNRMFTCCERKLLSKIDSKMKEFTTKKVIILPVTKYPCELCQRTLISVISDKEFIHKIKIKSPRKTKGGLKKSFIDDMDQRAKIIFDKSKN